MKTMMTVGLAFIAIAGGMMTIGAYVALSVDERIRDCKPVSVRVLSANVEESSGRHTTYTPVIRYQYQVGAATYENDKYMPAYDGNGAPDWVQRVVDRYQPGKSYTGFFMPGNPQDSFLVKEHTLYPYLLWLFPCLHFDIGLLLIIYALRRPAPRMAPSSAYPGWFTVRPYLHLSQKLSLIFVGLVVWCVLTGAGIGHYFLVDEPPHDVKMYVAAVICPLIALAIAYQWIKTAGPLFFLEEPQLLIDSGKAIQGQEMHVKLGLHARLRALIDELSIGLVCREDISTSDGSEQSDHEFNFHQVDENLRLTSGKRVWIESSVKFPADCQPTSSGNSTFDWLIVVRVRMFGDSGEDLCFPVEVDAVEPAVDAPADQVGEVYSSRDPDQAAEPSSPADPEAKAQEAHRRHTAMLDRIDRLSELE